MLPRCAAWCTAPCAALESPSAISRQLRASPTWQPASNMPARRSRRRRRPRTRSRRPCERRRTARAPRAASRTRSSRVARAGRTAPCTRPRRRSARRADARRAAWLNRTPRGRRGRRPCGRFEPAGPVARDVRTERDRLAERRARLGLVVVARRPKQLDPVRRIGSERRGSDAVLAAIERARVL